jgi:hypothetical protein
LFPIYGIIYKFENFSLSTNYLFQPSYWRGPKQAKSVKKEQIKELNTFEKENNEANPTVDIQNISKVINEQYSIIYLFFYSNRTLERVLQIKRLLIMFL